jgi:hypothetical protein
MVKLSTGKAQKVIFLEKLELSCLTLNHLAIVGYIKFTSQKILKQII